jgi:hypothetical protein
VAAFPEGWMSSGQISRDGMHLTIIYVRTSSERDEEEVGEGGYGARRYD